MKFSPTDCQKPEVLNKNMVKGNNLLCGYSFNFVTGIASIKKVAETAKSVGAIGFVLAVKNVSPGTKFDPVPIGMPGILITDVDKSPALIDYCKASTLRDWTGRVKSFKATGTIGHGLGPILYKSASFWFISYFKWVKWAQELALLWGKMRRRNIAKDDRSKLVSEALRKMKGKIHEIAGSHVSCRVVI